MTAAMTGRMGDELLSHHGCGVSSVHAGLLRVQPNCQERLWGELMDFEKFGGGVTADDITNYNAKVLLLRELNKGPVQLSEIDYMNYHAIKHRMEEAINYRLASPPDKHSDMVLTWQPIEED